MTLTTMQDNVLDYMHRTGWTRLLGSAAALALYVLGTALTPLADARLEASGRGQSIHVEAQPDQDCPPGHDHASCGMCTTLRNGAGPSGSVPIVPVALFDPAAWAQPVVDTPTLRFRTTQHSRAPPLS